MAFTIPHFITGARLLVKSASAIDKVEDLNGKKLVSTKGTTPLKAADQANRERLMGITIVEALTMPRRSRWSKKARPMPL